MRTKGYFHVCTGVLLLSSASFPRPVLSQGYVYVSQWGGAGTGNGQFNDPEGAAVDGEGNVYVSDHSDRIQKFTSSGAYLAQWGSHGSGNGQFDSPHGVAIGPGGLVYVADTNNNRIQAFSSDGTYVGQWGSLGSGDGQFQHPWGVAVDAGGNVYVGDSDNHRIQEFTGQGAYVRQWGSFGTGPSQFEYPNGVGTDPSGNVYVADNYNARVQKFTGDGTYVTEWGHLGTGPGEFGVLYGLAVDGDANVFVADTQNSRIEKFTGGGIYLTLWGSYGNGNGQFSGPFNVAVSQAGQVYVTDSGNNRIQRFAPLGEQPIISAALPDSGKIGAHITIIGDHFDGAYKVLFGGHGNASFVVHSSTSIEAVVDSGAVTGPIYVSTPGWIAISPFDFKVIPLDPRPHLVAVRDLPNDQGGKVGVAWVASEFDSPYLKVITGYRVWRRLNGAGAAARATSEAPAFFTRHDISPKDGTIETTFWESIAEQPAVFLEGYAFAAPTLQDSTEAANPYTAFFIQALTADPYTFYNSDVDSGYSVDNFAPTRPSAFAGVYMQGAVALHWGASTEKDLAGYRLYKGASTDFVPSASNLVVAQPDTGYVDLGGTLGDFYKLSAIDIHGNESRFALVMPTGPTDALASLVSANTEGGVAHLTWWAAGNPGLSATVYRRTNATTWNSVAQIVASGTGMLTYEDATVAAGQRYGYRLGIIDGGREMFLAEAWIDVPALVLAIKGAIPNPSRDDLVIELVLPNAEPASLDLLDMAGRRMFARDVGALGAGAHSLRIDEARRLPSGVYMLRLQQGGRHLSVKAVLMH